MSYKIDWETLKGTYIDVTDIITPAEGYDIRGRAFKIANIVVCDLIIESSNNAFTISQSTVGSFNAGYYPPFAINTFCGIRADEWVNGKIGYAYIQDGHGSLFIRGQSGNTEKFAAVHFAYALN